MIKGSDYLRKRIPQKGDYQTFLTEAAAIIEKTPIWNLSRASPSKMSRNW